MSPVCLFVCFCGDSFLSIETGSIQKVYKSDANYGYSFKLLLYWNDTVTSVLSREPGKLKKIKNFKLFVCLFWLKIGSIQATFF